MLKITNLLLLAMFGLLLVFAWATDSITLEGERTVYTVTCKGGDWQGRRCSGKLAADRRFRFRALRAHGEVLFWTVGASGPSGRYGDCSIHDGRNWQCKPNDDARRTVTLKMERGEPVRVADAPTLNFHEVPKWKWGLVKAGVWPGQEAMN